MKKLFSTLVFFLCMVLTSQIYAQTPNLNIDGFEYEINHTGSYEDYLIPTNIESGIMEFLLRGGDGGKNPKCDNDSRDDKSDGGKGGTITVNFAIGSEDGELEPGGTIRFVVGKRGTNQTSNNGGGAGGGGGTAILYKSPNATIASNADTPSLDMDDADTDWILLAVAGGGGGAYSRVTGLDICEFSSKNGTGANTGTSGKGGGGNNDGGTNGNGGETGSGRDGGAGGGYLTNGDQNDDAKNGKRGGLTGGAGGQQPNCGGCPGGGFGYGGGGSGRGESQGDAGAGGGGGFSGGAGGNDGNAAANNGGGAGCFVNDAALDGYDIDGGGSTDDPDNGRIKYRFLSNLIVTDGTNVRIDFNNSYQDLVIPEDIDLDQVDAISFILKGGDGGKSKPTQTVFRKGGAGATTTADFKIGNAADELKPGGTIRFIIGQKGNSFTQQGKSGGAGGGAGGTAILYKGPDVDEDGSCSQPSLVINDNCWTLLAVAGGGGGAHARFTDAGGSGDPGNSNQNGSDGTGGVADGEGAGGTNGTSGGTGGSDKAGGGGGYLPFGGGNPDPNKEQQGQPGVFTGGEGGRSIAGFVKGGFGYGGGGSGKIETGTNSNAAGGGGGGFSGGGGGGNSGKGGGGGSWFNPSALFGDTNKNGTDGSPDNGLAYYNTYKTDDQVGGVQAPVAKCNPTIVAEITGSESFPVTKDLVDNGSYDPNTPALNLTYTICSGTPGINEICAPTNSFACNLLGESRIRRLKVSNGVRDSYCSFVVEVEQGDVGTLNCPDPITVYSAECENLIGDGNTRIDLRYEDFATCNDNLSYFIVRPDQSIDTDFTFDNDVGIGRDTFEFGTSTVVYQSNYFDEDEAPGFQSCSFTVTVLPDDNENVFELECPDNMVVTLGEQDDDCVITINGNDSPGPFNDFEPSTTDGDLFWKVTTGSGAITEGVGVLEVFEFEIGDNIVEYTLNKCDDNVTRSCSFNVKVNGGQFTNNFRPDITCVSSSSSNPVDLSAYDDVSKNDPFIINQLVESATDDCYVESIELEGSYLINCTSVGDKDRIVITARDAQGETDMCEVWVRLRDDVGITCPDNFTTSIPSGDCDVPLSALGSPFKTRYLCGTGIDYTVDKFIDGQFEEFATSPSQGEVYTEGLYRLNFTETNSDGATSTCSYEVTVEDTEQPEAICETINVGITNPPNNIAELVAASSSDNCSSISFSTDQSFTFDCANVGLTSLKVTVTDESGNSNFCYGAVRIIDDVAPVINTCPADQTIFIDTGSCDATMPDLTEEVDATDNCGGELSFNQFPEEGSLLDFGQTQTVEITALDESGNAAETTCSFTLTVAADVPSLLTCKPNFTVNLEDGCTGFAPEASYYPDFFECVPGLQVSLSTVSGPNLSTIDLLNQTDDNGGFEFTAEGEYNFNYSVFVGGSSENCSTNVIVRDNQAPNAICNNYSVTLPNDGSTVELAVSQLATASTDNCVSNLTFETSFTECNPLCIDITTPTLTLDCDNVGNRNYNIKVKDDNGNTSTCTATLTVIDTSTPTAVCQDQTVQLNNSGNASIDPESINNGSSSLCGLSFSLDQSTFDCTDLDNPVTVTLTATDNNMNFSTCTAVVTVEDNIAPVAECQDQTVQLNANGEASIMPSQVDNNSSDNCDDLSFSLDQTTFDCDDVGSPVSVELMVTDGSNLFSTCTATITVEDHVSPNANCQNLTIALDANGEANITTSQIDNNSSDNCGAVSLSLNQTSFDCSEVGDNTVTLTVTDVNGNSNSCNATVTVQDNIMPNAICQDVSVQLDNNGEASISTDQVNNGSNDACGGLSFGLSQMDFDCNEVGNNTVTLTVTDENGNSSTCDATVSVADNMMPDAQCQDITIQLDNNGAASITTDQINNGSSDNCGAISLSLNQTSFDCNNVGNNTVTLTVNDANGNSSTCDATVTIEDDSAPIAVCKNLTANLNNAGILDITANQIDNGSSDNCGAVSLSLNQTSFDCSEVGNNTVTLTVTDANGNSSSCNATVTVQDNTNPTALCQNVTAVLDGSGATSITPEQVNNGSFDNCGTISLSLNQTNFDCEQVGEVSVTLTVTDDNENSSTCDATVTVEDNTAPTTLCINPTIQLDANGLATITPLHIDNGSYDNCEVDELSIDNKNFDCSNVGSNMVILTVLDVNGNSSTCTSTITIEDNVAPLANCKDITVALDETGNIIVDGQEVDNISWDACGIDTYVLDVNTFDCTNLGDNPVTLTVKDNNGNNNSCNATITIIDNTMPDLDCLNPTVYLDVNGQYTLSESEVFAGGTDNCGTVNFDQLAPANLDCSDIGGVVMVRVEANDGNGNGNSCVANVTVLDNINPIAVCNNTTVTFNGESDIQLLASDLLNQAASYDNCGAYSITTADPIITCDQLGTDVNVTIEIADNSGNIGTCTSTITVEGLPCNWSNDGGIGCIDNSVNFSTNGDVFTLVLALDQVSVLLVKETTSLPIKRTKM